MLKKTDGFRLFCYTNPDMKKWHVLILLAAIPLLGFAYYALSPLFITVAIDDALPKNGQSMTAPSPQPAEISSTSSPTPLSTPVIPQDGQAGAPVIGTIGHPASGEACIIEADGIRYVRYEDFKTINGPDLYVYLSKDLDAKDFVSLGTIPGYAREYQLRDSCRSDGERLFIRHHLV